MNTRDIMKDPVYQTALFSIENQILSASEAAKEEGVEFNDSQVRSILNKVRKSSEGKSPSIPDESPRDKMLAKLHGKLLELKYGLVFEDNEGKVEPFSTREWLLCLKTIEESIQTRSTGPGSRAYLEFVKGFIGKAKG